MKYLLMKAVDNNNFGIDVGVLEVASIPDNLEHAIKCMKLRAHEHCFILKFDETTIPSVAERIRVAKEEEARRIEEAKVAAELALASKQVNDMMIDQLIKRLLETKSEPTPTPPATKPSKES